MNSIEFQQKIFSKLQYISLDEWQGIIWLWCEIYPDYVKSRA